MSTQPHDPADIPPHLAGAAVPRPIEASNIHVRANHRCMAAMVVNVDAEDPLSAVFTVDAVIFQPPIKGSTDKFQKANNRPGSVRWANNLPHASPLEDHQLSWHFPARECLPPVVLEMLNAESQRQAQGQQ